MHQLFRKSAFDFSQIAQEAKEVTARGCAAEVRFIRCAEVEDVVAGDPVTAMVTRPPPTSVRT